MSHLLQSRVHYSCRGNVLCCDLLCLMADRWTEMEMSQRQPELTVDGAEKQFSEGAENNEEGEGDGRKLCNQGFYHSS